MSITATIARRLQGWRGDARLYRLSEPVRDPDWDDSMPAVDHVFVSAVSAPEWNILETYIFPASPEGEPISFSEMRGSYQGGLDHTEALLGAGWAVVE